MSTYVSIPKISTLSLMSNFTAVRGTLGTNSNLVNVPRLAQRVVGGGACLRASETNAHPAAGLERGL